MASVAEEFRIPKLRELGISEPMLRLAGGELIHEVFRDSCEGPPFYSYHGAWVPQGPTFVPLWDYCDSVSGVRLQPDGLEFIKYDIETPDVTRILSRTEQGFWAHQFNFLYECGDLVDDLVVAAKAVGFRYLELLLQARVAAEETSGVRQDKDEWLQQVVNAIDRGSIHGS